mmetsp:Transcript_5727/g.24173  ORF Transcript_5727/g.24173 Transcript_5727/m.24173 type:complete len:274 (-) Transcript_5727:119-940(-)
MLFSLSLEESKNKGLVGNSIPRHTSPSNRRQNVKALSRSEGSISVKINLSDSSWTSNFNPRYFSYNSIVELNEARAVFISLVAASRSFRCTWVSSLTERIASASCSFFSGSVCFRSPSLDIPALRSSSSCFWFSSFLLKSACSFFASVSRSFSSSMLPRKAWRSLSLSVLCDPLGRFETTSFHILERSPTLFACCCLRSSCAPTCSEAQESNCFRAFSRLSPSCSTFAISILTRPKSQHKYCNQPVRYPTTSASSRGLQPSGKQSPHPSVPPE